MNKKELMIKIGEIFDKYDPNHKLSMVITNKITNDIIDLITTENNTLNKNFSVENDLAAFYESLDESQKLRFMNLINNFNPTNKMKLLLDSLANPKEIDNKLLKLNYINRSYLDKCIRECKDIWTADGFNIDPKPFYDYIEDILARNLNRTGQLTRMNGDQIDKYLLNNKKRYPEFKKEYVGDMPVEDIMNDILSATSDFLTGNSKFMNKNFSNRVKKCFSNKILKFTYDINTLPELKFKNNPIELLCDYLKKEFPDAQDIEKVTKGYKLIKSKGPMKISYFVDPMIEDYKNTKLLYIKRYSPYDEDFVLRNMPYYSIARLV